jgi:hypothetical protein
VSSPFGRAAMKPDNVHSVALINAWMVWEETGFRGDK